MLTKKYKSKEGAIKSLEEVQEAINLLSETVKVQNNKLTEISNIVEWLKEQSLPKLNNHCPYCGEYLESHASHNEKCSINRIFPIPEITTTVMTNIWKGEIIPSEAKVVVKEDKSWWMGRIVERNFSTKQYEILDLSDYKHYTIEEEFVYQIPEFVTTLEHALKYL